MMTLFWKSAAALSLAITGLGAAVVPAQAQYYGYGNGHRDGWRGDRGNDRRDYRRGDRRRDWRDDRRGWRGHNAYRTSYRQRCWTEWRYDHYRDRDVRVRICR